MCLGSLRFRNIEIVSKHQLVDELVDQEGVSKNNGTLIDLYNLRIESLSLILRIESDFYLNENPESVGQIQQYYIFLIRSIKSNLLSIFYK